MPLLCLIGWSVGVGRLPFGYCMRCGGRYISNNEGEEDQGSQHGTDGLLASHQAKRRVFVAAVAFGSLLFVCPCSYI